MKSIDSMDIVYSYLLEENENIKQMSALLALESLQEISNSIDLSLNNKKSTS